MSRHRTPQAQAQGRRIPRPPANRGPIVLAALVLGALIAWLPMSGPTPQPATTAESIGYGIGSDTGTPQLAEDTPRPGLSAAEAAARLAEMQASRAEREAAAPEHVLPVSGRLTSCFCMRWGTMHWGIDIAAPTGTTIVAPEAGVILESGPASGYGNVIYMQHANGDVTVYGHMSRLIADAGDIVEPGQVIAEVGSLGNSTGPHLHFEVYEGGLDGERIDPQPWLLERDIDVSALPTSD